LLFSSLSALLQAAIINPPKKTFPSLPKIQMIITPCERFPKNSSPLRTRLSLAIEAWIFFMIKKERDTEAAEEHALHDRLKTVWSL